MVPPERPPELLITESMIKKSKKSDEASPTEEAKPTTPRGSSGLKEEHHKKKDKKKSKKKKKKVESEPEKAASVDAASESTTTTTTTTTSPTSAGAVTSPTAGQEPIKKIPHAGQNPKLSLNAKAAAGAAAEAQAERKKKGLDDVPASGSKHEDDDEDDDDLPDVEVTGDEQEFLTMSMNLQPHAGQVEQFNVDGIGDVDVVTMPFDDYSIQDRDLWPEFGTPMIHYNNLWYRDNGGMYSGINGISYFFGIIDILMLYTPKKSLERTFKTIRYHGQGEVSSCPPNRYAVRFLSFINSATL